MKTCDFGVVEETTSYDDGHTATEIVATIERRPDGTFSEMPAFPVTVRFCSGTEFRDRKGIVNENGQDVLNLGDVTHTWNV